MKQSLLFTLSMAGMTALAHAQAPTITAGDMFNQPGQYYRAYANHFEASILSPTYFQVAGRMGSAGENRFWDFSNGPTEVIQRYDYLSPSGITQATDFPSATVVEQKTIETGGDSEWLMFEQVPALGRRVYGFYSEAFSSLTPSVVFNPSTVDWPDTINYLDTWQPSSFTTYHMADSGDITWLEPFDLQTVWSSTFTVDAWGVMLLPDDQLVDVLRVNEELQLDISVNLGEGYQFIETDYARNYYWLSPGHGIVAQLHSRQGGAVPPENYSEATAFIRMFETNLNSGSGGNDPQPVTGIKLTVDRDNNRVLIRWNKAANTSRYRVEYTTGGFRSEDWQILGTETTDDFKFDPAGIAGQTRFYRIISIK